MLVRLMTHNVWECDDNSPKWKEAGNDCSAETRTQGFLRLYDETCPDVVGFQEMTSRMISYMSQELINRNKKYTFIWGGYAPIMYNSEKFELIDSEWELYPEQIEGLGGPFNNDKRKSWIVAVFRIKENGKIFAYATTHLWWKRNPAKEEEIGQWNVQPNSNEARAWQMELLMSKLEKYSKKYDCPMILTGDMNTPFNSKPIKTAIANGFLPARDLATDFADNTMGYHYCYPDRYETFYYDAPFEAAIDHVMVKNVKEKSIKNFVRYSPDYYFPLSDHSPAYIDIEL